MANNITIQNKIINVGDTVKIGYKFKEKDKEKIQNFKGILIAIKGSGNNKMITVRKLTKSKISVERIFPAISPYITNIDIVKKSNATKAKLYYLRNRSDKEIADKLYTS